MKLKHASLQLIATLPFMLMAQQIPAHGGAWWKWHHEKEAPDPEVTYSPEDSLPDIPIAPSGEVYLTPTDDRILLHNESHTYSPIVTATLPPIFEPPEMNSLEDFVLHKDDLVVVNPAPDEFLWIMEGQRHGYENLSIVLTETQTGNGAPLHTHVGEEAHVLMEGRMRYVLDGEEFTAEAPYIINIPSMVPHAFMNIDDDPAELVGIFPDSNHWEYDVLDAQVFADEDYEDTNDDDRDRRGHQRRRWIHKFPDRDAKRLEAWYSHRNRDLRMESFRRRTRHND